MLLIFIILDIISLVHYLLNEHLYLLTLSNSHSPLPKPLVTTNLISFSVSLFTCFRSTADLQHCYFLNIVIGYFYTFPNDHYDVQLRNVTILRHYTVIYYTPYTVHSNTYIKLFIT